MSAESLQRILAKTLPQIEQACREGRGEELLHDFLREVAIDFAANVFLKMEDETAKASAADADALWAWVNAFPHEQGLALLDSITSTMVEFGASRVGLEVEKAHMVAATAYRERLEELMATAQTGGAA